MLLFIFHIQLQQLHQIVDLCINFRHLLGNRVFGPTFNFFPVDYNVLAFGFVFFQELLDIFREVLEKEDLIPVQEELDQICERLPDRLKAKRLLANVGIVDNIVRAQEETVHFDSGLEFVIAPLIRQHCLDECLGLIKDRGWREGVLAGMIRALDTYFPDGIDLTLVMGRLEGNKL